jgi:hypothetical protein
VTAQGKASSLILVGMEKHRTGLSLHHEEK